MGNGWVQAGITRTPGQEPGELAAVLKNDRASLVVSCKVEIYLSKAVTARTFFSQPCRENSDSFSL